MYKVLNTLLARKEDWDDHGGLTTRVSLLPQIWKTFKISSFNSLMAELAGCYKRKDRSSDNSENGICSPQ